MIRMHLRQPVNSIFYFKDRSRQEIRKQGRWGPKWLHDLVYRVALNLGMIHNVTDIVEKLNYVEIPNERYEQVGTLFNNIRRACIDYRNYYNIKQFDVIVGIDEFHEIVIDKVIEMPLYGLYERNDGRTIEVQGIRIRVIPGAKGFFIIPRDEKRL